MITVADPSDERIAAYRDIGNHEALLARGLFVAEGRLVVRRLLEDGRHAVESILVTPPARESLGPILDASGVPVLLCEPDVLTAVTGYDFHRGCLALGRRRVIQTVVESFGAARRVLVLDGVGNPDNIGGIFRSALAFGAGGVVLDDRSGDPLYRKAIRTSMAATLRVPFARAPLAEALAALRASGFALVALTPSADAVDLREFPAPSKAALLLGAEGDGLSNQALEYADARVRIAVDATADSLNVAVAAGIALYALA